jgi:Cu+-exporting ATPase
MAEVIHITGMHCGGCVNRVTKALKAIDDGVTVTLDPPQATFSEGADVSLEAVNALLAKVGEYRAAEPE